MQEQRWLCCLDSSANRRIPSRSFFRLAGNGFTAARADEPCASPLRRLLLCNPQLEQAVSLFVGVWARGRNFGARTRSVRTRVPRDDNEEWLQLVFYRARSGRRTSEAFDPG